MLLLLLLLQQRLVLLQQRLLLLLVVVLLHILLHGFACGCCLFVVYFCYKKNKIIIKLYILLRTVV